MGEILGELVAGVLRLPKHILLVAVVIGAIWLYGGFDSSDSGQRRAGSYSAQSSNIYVAYVDNTRQLNLRSGPGANFGIVTALNPSTGVTVTGNAGNGWKAVTVRYT